MTNYIILALCLLILFAYLFDITSKYTKMPGVILLIGLGIGIQVLVDTTGFSIPDMRPILPVIGTIGLILIVMEASLDLKLGRKKFGLIVKSASAAIFLFAFFVTIMTFIMVNYLGYKVIDSLLNAIPFGIISSAVAIPSSINFNEEQREFIIYESSLSDIIGILVFDFIILYGDSPLFGLISFTLKGMLTIIIAVVITSALAFLLHKITYHINYVIILTSVVLVYTLEEMIHLPALLLILAFGMALSNYKLFKHTFIKRHVDFDKFEHDLNSFSKIMRELTFIVRSFFFIMFGYYSKINGLFDLHNVITAACIFTGIYLLRIIFLKRSLKLPVLPFLYFSPRGLVTILLFLSIPASSRIGLINEEVVTLVILMTILFMMIGNIFYKKEISTETYPVDPGEEHSLDEQTF
jgi:Kef-type K+ transport system membrane component KefB